MQIIENHLLLSGLFRDSQEKAGLLESAGPETAAPGPSESYAGHACVSTERVRVCDFDLSLPHQIDVHLSLSLHLLSLICSLTLKSPCWRLNVKLSLFHWMFFTFFSFVFFPSSWTYGSNSLPTAGSVSGGVARRGQRQFQMPPRGLPAGRMGLLSPSGIGGASPRHTLTSPALAAQGRQVSSTPTAGLRISCRTSFSSRPCAVHVFDFFLRCNGRSHRGALRVS